MHRKIILYGCTTLVCVPARLSGGGVSRRARSTRGRGLCGASVLLGRGVLHRPKGAPGRCCDYVSVATDLAEKGFGAFRLGVIEERLRGGVFDDSAGIHKDDSVRHLAREAHFMGHA